MNSTPLEHKYRNHPAMQLLCRALRKEVRLKAVFAILGTLTSGFLLYLSFARNTILTVIFLVCLLLGFRFLIKTLREISLENNRLLLLLNRQPEKIVWVYALNTQRLPFGLDFSESGVLYFKLNDGDEFSVALPAKKLKLVSHFLNRVLPKTVFGYSPERAENYRQSPANFKG